MKNLKLLVIALIGTFLSLSAQAQTCKAEYSLYNSGPFYVGDTISFKNTSTYNAMSRPDFIWSFGDGNNSYLFEPMHLYAKAGVYAVCLYVVDSFNNCSSVYCDSIEIRTSGGSSSSCKSDFSSKVSNSNSCVIEFTNKSATNLSATWSFGDGNSSSSWSPSHTYSKDGWYNVSLTVFDSSRTCANTSYERIYVQSCGGGSSSCKTSFSYYRDSLDTCKTTFVASSTGMSAFSNYSWSYGDGTYGYGNSSSHKYTRSGWYGVTLTASDSSANCTATYTDSVYAIACGTTGGGCRLALAGQVLTGNSFATSGVAYLIEKNGVNLVLVDTTYLDSMGMYYFGSVCQGDYYIKAALSKSDLNYADYLPTYYGDKLRWDSVSATSITSSNYRLDINLEKGNNPGGKGFIGGSVRKGANKREGEVIENIEVVVLNEDFSPSAYSMSNESGEFSMDELAFGKYFLFVDVPGVKSLGTWIEITEESPSVKDIEIVVEENQIATSISQNVLINQVAIYPNPATSSLFISTGEQSAIIIEIVDVFGKKILYQKVYDGQVVDISALNPGTYILKSFNADNGQQSGQTRFIKD